MKKCSKCKKYKDNSNFTKDSRLKSGLASQCKDCVYAQREIKKEEHNKKQREARKENPERFRNYSKKSYYKDSDRTKRRSLKKGHNISLETYNKMRQNQNYCCGICKTPELNKYSLHVDHNHNCCKSSSKSCGECVRGLLCFGCNSAIGLFLDDILFLNSAIQYILYWEENTLLLVNYEWNISGKTKQEISKNNNLRVRYKIGLNQYQELWSSQNQKCKICNISPINNIAAVVDHDHKCCSGDRSCGKCVRNILCQRCNTGLGQLKENVSLIQEAICYLIRNP